MATQNLPAKNNAAEIRALLQKSRKQFEMALPKHLPVDRLLRVAMTSIQRNPKLMQCTQTSLLSCVMTCAQLGLEPDQFLGQAYLIPFKNNKKGGVYECQIIPGYRGYISLARRTGEVQTLSAQVVYENDNFALLYGTEDKLEHRPAIGSDRGNPIGAYCVIKYKDGGYSFDFMSVSDIEKIRKRSKSANDGPWVTDWDEMAKKTVIRRHIKLAPLSIEFQTAAVLEERAMSEESQMDLIGNFEEESEAIDVESSADDIGLLARQFDISVPGGTDSALLESFIASIAKAQHCTADEVKAAATKDPTAFWNAFGKYARKQEKATAPEPEAAPADNPPEAKPADLSPLECPEEPGTYRARSYCSEKCGKFDGCPAWEGLG